MVFFLLYLTAKIIKMSGIIRLIFLVAAFMGWKLSWSQIRYDDYFTAERIRYNFILAGNQEETRIYPLLVSCEPQWAGSKVNLVEPFSYGTFRFRITDEASGEVIFSRGFCTLFQEWQTTEGAKTTYQAFDQALFFPFPKKRVHLSVESRNWQGTFDKVFETVVDPGDYFIHKETPAAGEVIRVLDNGPPESHVDLIFLSEGYTAEEKEKFVLDATRLSEYIMTVSPFRENREKFNISAMWTPSTESGTDVPGEGLYRNTRFNSTFFTFNIDRYLTSSDMRSIYDAVAGVPWDHLVVLVNSERYGGGGFYNFLTVCTSGHALSGRVLLHELGHALAGLGDEYYNSEVAYVDYYNLSIEPWEPNLTTLVDFSSKWAELVPDTIPVPTPRTARYAVATGAFEGGGYLAKGIYSPMQECRMKSIVSEEFCPVCKNAIWVAIDRLTR